MKRAGLGVVVACMVICPPVESQQVSLRDLSLGVSYGYVSNPPGFFTNAICPDEHPSTFLVHGALRLTGLFFVSLGVSHNTESPGSCVNGLVHPIPEEGPFTARSRFAERGLTGYPFTAAEFQVGVHAKSPFGVVRVGVGPVWFLNKHLIGTKAAAALAVPIADLPVALLIGFDQTWLNIPYVDTVFHYQDGQLVDGQVTASHSREQVRVLRAGMEIRF